MMKEFLRYEKKEFNPLPPVNQEEIESELSAKKGSGQGGSTRTRPSKFFKKYGGKKIPDPKNPKVPRR